MAADDKKDPEKKEETKTDEKKEEEKVFDEVRFVFFTRKKSSN